MKVNNPKFNSTHPQGTVRCKECPFADKWGDASGAMARLCAEFGGGHEWPCPTRESYAEACELADKMKEEGK